MEKVSSYRLQLSKRLNGPKARVSGAEIALGVYIDEPLWIRPLSDSFFRFMLATSRFVHISSAVTSTC
jgi:hypothetical protein